jgi:hypothetical protein
MNVGRGLFRAWIVISILWIISAGSFVYAYTFPQIVQASFQPVNVTKAGWSQTDFSKPFYETMRSPSAERLSITFFPIDWQQKMDWDKDASMMRVDMPDGSHLYVNAQYNYADQKYIAHQFWDQRWDRYANFAELVAGWLLMPCAVLFILGYALLWVGRGFKAAKT